LVVKACPAWVINVATHMATIKGKTESRVNKPMMMAMEQKTSAKITSDNDTVPPRPMGLKFWLMVEKCVNLYIPWVSIMALIDTRRISSPKEAVDPLTHFVEKKLCSDIRKN